MKEGYLVSQNGPTSLAGSQEPVVFSRQEHMLHQLSLRKSGAFREPKRASSTHDYATPTTSAEDARQVIIHQVTLPRSALASLSAHEDNTAREQPSQAAFMASAAVGIEEERSRPRRPKLGAPRRSYSVMNFEPVPPTQVPSENLPFPELPPELHMAIFDFLDPIDSTCLGLTSKHFYALHRRMLGTVSLSAGRDGPNDQERAWYLANRIISPDPASGVSPSTTNTLGDTNLAALRIHGQGLCKKCGINRCQLHKHLQEWMGEGREYCSVREKFGPAAPEGVRAKCYRSNPNKPGQCGRHRVAKAKEAKL